MREVSYLTKTVRGASMRKNILSFLCIVSVLILTACKADNPVSDISASASKEKMSKPEFPLDKDTILKTIGELGLPCVISEDESQESLSRENAVYSNYILRDPERKYNVDNGDAVLYAGIISGMVDGNRYLSSVFDAKSLMRDEKPFAWEDWKQEIIFTSVLYGGFEDEEEVYWALSGLAVPDDDGVLKWGIQLSDGYCGVQRGGGASSGSYALWINFYESEELYLKAEQEKKEAYEQAQEDMKRRQDENLKR